MAQQQDAQAMLRQIAELKQKNAAVEQKNADLEQAKAAAEQAKAAAEQKNADLEQDAQATTFNEMLEAYHQYTEKLKVETDKKLSTKGTTTDPKGRYCPTQLRQWKDFPELRDRAFDEVQTALEDSRLFEARHFIKQLVSRETARKLASEKDLGLFLHNLLDVPAASVASNLASRWQLGKEVLFHNHGNFEVEMMHLEEQAARRKNAVPTDQWCLLKLDNTLVRPILVIEHKPPHKLTKDTIFNGLDKEMELKKDILSQATVPTGDHEKFVYHSQMMVAAVMTQTYDYMIRSGLQYGCVITGETLTFLFLNKEDPNILYYHLTEPSDEVKKEVEAGGKPLAFTAVAQMVEFLVLALETKPQDQDWTNDAIKKALTWEMDPEEVLRDFHEKQRTFEKPSSVYKNRVKVLKQRTPYKTRLYLNKLSRQPNDDPPTVKGEKSPPDSDSDDQPDDTPTRPPKGRRLDGKQATSGARSSTQQSKTEPQSQKPQQQTRSYCTQVCLLGLVRQLPLDPDCPNIASHGQVGHSTHHAFTLPTFTTSVREQLGRSLVAGVSDLHTHGSRGALFKIELLSHGYVFVAKACIDLLADSFRNEGRVYQRLADLQGDLIPVYLGNMDMINPWWAAHYEFRHMLLMSHAGQPIDEGNSEADVEAFAEAYVDRCRERGVYNKDLHRGNVLWCEERGTVMFIDLEDVVLFEPRANAVNLKPAAPPKRRILQELEVTGSRIPNFENHPRDGRKRKHVFNYHITREELAGYLAERRKREAEEAEEMRMDGRKGDKRLRTIEETENEVEVEDDVAPEEVMA